MIAGIDLGTTHSLVGVMESGFPVLIADAQGRRLTPSAVWFPECGEPVVGWSALEKNATHPTQVVTSVKRLIGRRIGEVVASSSGCALEAGPDGELRVAVGGHSHRPEEISAIILSKLKTDLEKSCGTPVIPMSVS